MLLNTWEISGIVAGCLLAILIPAIIWLRFGKKGKEAFGEPKKIEDRIKKNKLEILEIDKKIKKMKDRLKAADDVNLIFRIKEEIKLHEKMLERCRRELVNLDQKNK